MGQGRGAGEQMSASVCVASGPGVGSLRPLCWGHLESLKVPHVLMTVVKVFERAVMMSFLLKVIDFHY